MFGKSRNQKVHELIVNQIKDVEACLIHFEGFLHAAATPETVAPTLRTLAVNIDKAEDDADLSLRLMIDSLGNAPLLPATRQDLIEIASSCDRIANKCEHTCGMMVWQNFRFPTECTEGILEIMTITKKQFELLKTAIIRLFGSFGELLRDHSILDDIRVQESLVDKIEESLYVRIFAMDIGLAERTQLARFVELVCDISDIIENIADRIQIMLITRKA